MAENIILEILRAVQADIAGIKTDAASIKTDVAAATRQLAGHTRVLDILQQDTRLIRAAVNDIARDNVTPGEVEALHHDLNRVVRELAELTGRVEAIEARHD
jgi:hypothetical protein